MNRNLALDIIDDQPVRNGLENLQLVNLVRIAQFNTDSLVASRVEFARRYRQKVVKLCLNEITTLDSDENGNIVSLYGFQNAIDVLRCFGCLMLKLDIDFARASFLMQERVWQYLNFYCFESVIDLRVREVNFNLMENFGRCFTSLQSIEFTNCDFINPLFSIHVICPNLQNIDFRGWNMMNFTADEFGVEIDQNSVSQLIEYVPSASN